MGFFGYMLFAGLIAAADQVTKYLVVQNLGLYEEVTLLPGVLGLTHVRNQGAAFSSFQGMQWLFALIFAAFTLALLYEYFKKPLPLAKVERWCLAAIYGGGLGNMIDRVRLGYVVDMLETLFMDFPVFNLADCFISCGCVLLMVRLAFFNKAIWKDGKK